MKFVLDQDQKKLLKMLKLHEKEYTSDKKKRDMVREKKGKGFLNINYKIYDNLIDPNKFKLAADVYPMGREEGRVSLLGKYIVRPDSFFDIIKNFQVKELFGTSCTTFKFDLSGYCPVGGLPMPTKIQLTSEIQEKLGEVQLGGFLLSFKNSPIGVDQVELQVEEDLLSIDISIDYKLSSVERLFEKSFGISKDVANLFVVKRP